MERALRKSLAQQIVDVLNENQELMAENRLLRQKNTRLRDMLSTERETQAQTQPQTQEVATHGNKETEHAGASRPRRHPH